MGQVWTIKEPLIHCPRCSNIESLWKMVFGIGSDDTDVYCYWCSYYMSKERFELRRTVGIIEIERNG